MRESCLERTPLIISTIEARNLSRGSESYRAGSSAPVDKVPDILRKLQQAQKSTHPSRPIKLDCLRAFSKGCTSRLGFSEKDGGLHGRDQAFASMGANRENEPFVLLCGESWEHLVHETLQLETFLDQGARRIVLGHSFLLREGLK